MQKEMNPLLIHGSQQGRPSMAWNSVWVKQCGIGGLTSANADYHVPADLMLILGCL